jgi:UDP-N-acetylglucosamine 2-epimerase (non-hydrolysing)
MKIHLIAGARPNFMKIAPIIDAIHEFQKKGADIGYQIVHTGQHWDNNMSETFFKELNIPEPEINLGCGGGSQAEQTAAIMVSYEKYLLENPVDLVIVVGDVTSTMACSIVAKKLNTRLAHVEAGIRSFDLTMPEEINRMVTDCLTDYFFTTTTWAGENLRKQGIEDERIFFVGNVMIDTLLAHRDRFREPELWRKASLSHGNYIVMTLHRPANVDNSSRFLTTLDSIINASRGLPVLFPIHPRTSKILHSVGFTAPPSLYLTEPLGYLEFSYLIENAKAVITDSGGITEETTFLGIPCITLRNNTERPETVTIGTNEIIGTDPMNIAKAFDKLFEGKWKKGEIPEKWDGRAASRIVKTLVECIFPR